MADEASREAEAHTRAILRAAGVVVDRHRAVCTAEVRVGLDESGRAGPPDPAAIADAVAGWHQLTDALDALDEAWTASEVWQLTRALDGHVIDADTDVRGDYCRTCGRRVQPDPAGVWEHVEGPAG